MKYVFLLIVIFLYACEGEKSKSNTPVQEPSTLGSYSMIDIAKWNKEYLPYDSILMNGKVALVTDTITLFNFLGRPEKVVPIPFERNNCLLLGKGYSNNANYLVYGNTVFEQLGSEVIVNTIDFKSTNLALVSSKINLNEGVTPWDIQKIFPESGRLLGGMGGNMWSGNIMVSASRPMGGIHDVWFLIFRRERLERVVLFTAPYMEDL